VISIRIWNIIKIVIFELVISMLDGSLCHHGMARRRVADGGDDLPANVLNKQPRTNDKRCSSSLGVGRGAKTLLNIKVSLLRNSLLSV
jgi:hypothetical protein